MTSSGKASRGTRPRRALLADLVPLTTRPTFLYDLRSAPLNGFYLGVMTLLPWVLKYTLDGSDWEVAVLSAAPPLSHLFDVYWAHRCENRRKMPFVLWPGLVSRFLIVLCGLAVHSLMLVVVASISYMVASVATPAANSIWRTNYPGTHRYQAVGAVMAVMNLVMGLTAFAAGLLLRTFDNAWLFRIVLAAGAAVGMAGVAVFSRIKVRGEGPGTRHRRAPQGRFSLLHDTSLLWRNRKFGKFMLIQFVVGFANIMAGPVLIALLKWQNADWRQAALVLGVAPSLLAALTMPFWGALLQRINPMQARTFLSIIWAAAYLLIGLSGTEVNRVIVAQMLMGAAAGATSLLWSLQQMYFARKEDVPKYMGVHCTLTGIRGLVAPFVGVWLMKLYGEPHVVFFLSSIVMAAAGFLSWRLAVQERRETRHTGHVDGAGFEG